MARTKRPHLKTRTPKAQPVKIVRLGLNHLCPLARAEAKRRSGGDASRVEVISPTEFIVR